MASASAEFAALLGVSYTTIWRHIRDKKIETVIVGGVRLIPRAYAVQQGLITSDDTDRKFRPRPPRFFGTGNRSGSNDVTNVINLFADDKGISQLKLVISGNHKPSLRSVGDGGRFQIGLHDDAASPFETRRFAEAVAVREGRHAPIP